MQHRYILASLFTAAVLGATPAWGQWTNGGPLSQARGRMASATVGDLVFFAGGEDPSAPLNFDVMDIYDAATDTWTVDQLSVVRSRLAATGVGPLALFAGGGIDPATHYTVVDVYDTQAMGWTTPAALSLARSGLAATTVGSKAIFAGGQTPTGVTDRVDIYDHQTGQWTIGTPLSVPRAGLAATTVGTKAIFAGGYDPLVGFYDTVDIYDDSTNQWTQTVLTQARADLTAATAGTRAYFAGGFFGFGPGFASDVIDVFDDLAGSWNADTLPEARFGMSSTAVGNTLILAGGSDTNGFVTPTVHMLNVGTGQWDSSGQLTLGAYGMGAATVAGKALFAGGLWEPLGNSQTTDRVDVYEPVGVSYCAATVTSAGCAATISASGSASLAANDLVLTSNCMPDGVFIFFHATTQMQVPFGNGYLCANGNLFRILPAAIASGGLAQKTVDLPSVNVTTPGPRNFQCWFRDPTVGAGFNTSDALAITFVP